MVRPEARTAKDLSLKGSVLIDIFESPEGKGKKTTTEEERDKGDKTPRDCSEVTPLVKKVETTQVFSSKQT